MRAKLLPTAVALAVAATLTLAGIDSPRPLKCAKGRKVVLYKQKGAQQNLSVDKKVASDTADLSGDRYAWSTGNTGLSGKFYAHVNRTPDCKPASSRTVKTTKH